MQAKQIANTEEGKDSKKVGKVIFDVDAGAEDDDGTFVTGLGIPGKRKKQKAVHRIEEKFYARIEDELLDKVENTEKEMHDMMKYLNAVENMMSGDDLSQIRRMLDYTTQSVRHHSKAYSGIKDQVSSMNKDADNALKKLSQHSDDIKNMLKETEEMNRKLGTKVVIHEEDSEDDEADKKEDQEIHIGNERVLDVSL